MTAWTRHAGWAVLAASAAMLAPFAFGRGLYEAAATAPPFIDAISVFHSIFPSANLALKLIAAGVAGAAISAGLGGFSAPTWRYFAVAALILLNPVFLSASAYGADALMLFSVSLIAWRAVLLFADRRDYAGIMMLGGALAIAGAGSSFFLLALPVLFIGLPALSPWRLTARGAAGVSLAYWSPLVMTYFAYFYLAWIASERLPLSTHFSFDARMIVNAPIAVWAVPLAAPSILIRTIDWRAGTAQRIGAAVIMLSLLAGSLLAAGAGGDPILFAASAFAAQIAAESGKDDGPFIRSLAVAFVAGVFIIALRPEFSLFSTAMSRVSGG